MRALIDVFFVKKAVCKALLKHPSLQLKSLRDRVQQLETELHVAKSSTTQAHSASTPSIDTTRLTSENESLKQQVQQLTQLAHTWQAEAQRFEQFAQQWQQYQVHQVHKKLFNRTNEESFRY